MTGHSVFVLVFGTIALLLAGYAGYLIAGYRRKGSGATMKQNSNGEHAIKVHIDASASTNDIYIRTVDVKSGATVSTITLRNPSEVELIAEQLERAAGFAMGSKSILRRPVKVELP